jgi:hypothetical protein
MDYQNPWALLAQKQISEDELEQMGAITREPSTEDDLDPQSGAATSPAEFARLRQFALRPHFAQGMSDEINHLSDKLEQEQTPVEKHIQPPAAAYKGRKYHIETARVPNPQSPTGYSVSIKQVYE